MEARCCSDNIFQSFWVLQHLFHNTAIRWNGMHIIETAFFNAWIVALDCTEYSHGALSSLNVYLHHTLTWKFYGINQHILLNNGSNLAHVQNYFTLI